MATTSDQPGAAGFAFSPEDANTCVRWYIDAIVDSRDTLATAIHARDEMFLHTKQAFRGDHDRAVCSYFDAGQQIFQTISQIVQRRFGGFQNIRSYLDFAAGYGRSTRFVVRQLPAERVWMTEISEDAVRFQTETFGVHGLLSCTVPEDFACAERFDCITVISLFSHLPERTFIRWLRKLYTLLRDDSSCLIFTTHGPTVNPYLAMPESGIGFEEKSEIETLAKQDYGSTFVTEGFVSRAIQEATDGEAAYVHFPRGLCGFQDLYIVSRRESPAFRDLQFRSKPKGCLDQCSPAGTGLLTVSGWAIDATDVVEVQVLLNGRLVQRCRPWIPRPDVAAHFGNDRYATSGFSFPFPVRDWILGTLRRLPRMLSAPGLRNRVMLRTVRFLSEGRPIAPSDVLTLIAEARGERAIFFHDTVARALQTGRP